MALGLVKFFGSRKPKAVNEATDVTTSVTIVPELKQPEIISDFAKEPERQSTALLPASAGMKRGPGRPKKIEQVAYAKDVEQDPKLKSGS